MRLLSGAQGDDLTMPMHHNIGHEVHINHCFDYLRQVPHEDQFLIPIIVELT